MSHPNTPTEAEARRTIRSSRFILRLSRNWLVIALGFLLVYFGLSLTPPVFLKLGMDGAADVVYKIYSPMCHQFAFRSWFLFGEQVVYPREAAGSSLMSFEDAVAASGEDHFDGLNLSEWTADLQVKARAFTGNEYMGYKTALCERDVAIYATMFLAGLLFISMRRWLGPVPLWLYAILGLGPLGLDGFSQLFSYPPFEFWPIRETLPGYRVLTGALFGLMNVWLAFPHLERSMNETVEALEIRLAHAEQFLAERGGDR